MRFLRIDCVSCSADGVQQRPGHLGAGLENGQVREKGVLRLQHVDHVGHHGIAVHWSLPKRRADAGRRGRSLLDLLATKAIGAEVVDVEAQKLSQSDVPVLAGGAAGVGSARATAAVVAAPGLAFPKAGRVTFFARAGLRRSVTAELLLELAAGEALYVSFASLNTATTCTSALA
jgi:hypothetical protein